MPSSFRFDGHLRPLGYRTPSPPQHAIEPLSPHSSSAAQELELQCQTSKSGCPDRYHDSYCLSSHDSHNLSGEANLTGNICICAEIPPRRVKRFLDWPPTLERPFKRARSERLPSPGVYSKSPTSATRPISSYEHIEQNKLSEAELLLNFSQVVRVQTPSIIKSRRWKSQGSFVPGVHCTRWEPDIRLTNTEKMKSANLVEAQERPIILRDQLSLRHNDSATTQIHESDVPQANCEDLLNTIMTADSRTSPSRLPVDLSQADRDNGKSGQQDPLAETDRRNAITAGKHSICQVSAGEAKVSQGCSTRPTKKDPDRLNNDDITTAAQDLASHSIADHVALSVSDARITNEKCSRSSAVIAVCKACSFSRTSSGIEGENSATSWISCDGCKDWFHFACAGFKNEREVRVVDKYRCKTCRPIYGATTYVRKSSRAHSAIDYAGLHQGVIKTSDERTEHHYIQPIREGVITFLPESFARMRPELVTAEFFEKSGGMKEPIIIPAAMNPQPDFLHSLGRIEDIWTKYEQGIPSPEDQITRANNTSDLESQVVEDEGQDALGMILPQGLSVRHVAKLYGEEEKVEVIDVKSQNGENKRWNMRRWAEYYENAKDKVVRNVISLEVSQSRLGRLIRRPKVVRDLDLQDMVWPEEQAAKGEYPRVQFYCLMSVANCFTDFHIDFGGSSVFYHVLKGRKTFLFIPPKEKHLKKYEEWCMSPAQNWTFLADQTKECYRVDLYKGDTMLIPSGWIHAVWTPEDSLVVGGNFLTRMNFGMQLRIAQLEKATGVARKFRYPSFQKLHWYTAFQYLDRDPLPEDIERLLYNGEVFHRACPIFELFDSWGENSLPGKENYHARYYSQSELDGLPELTRYLLRTALIDCGSLTEGITAEVRNAVKRSIPRSHGEPLDVTKKFAAWCAWKRGNEPIPHWAYPSAEPKTMVHDKLSATTMRKLDREAALEAALRAPRRQSARMQAQPNAVIGPLDAVSCGEGPDSQSMLQASKESHQVGTGLEDYTEDPNPVESKDGANSSTSYGGLNRKTACETCRKRRRACKHKSPSYDGSISDICRDRTEQGDTGTSEMVMEPSEMSTMFSIVRERRLSANSPADAHAPNIRKVSRDATICKEEWELSREEQSLETVSGNAIYSRSRTKACHDCRKSKRRCVHDAFGNEDPIKIAEQIIPRPHARKAHRGNTELARQVPAPQADKSRTRDQPSPTALVANMTPAAQSHVSCERSSVEEKWNLVPQNETSTPSPKSPGSIIESSVTSLDERHVSDSVFRTASIGEQDDCHLKQAGWAENLAKDSSLAGSVLISPSTIEQPVGHTSLMSPPASLHDELGSSPNDIAKSCSPSPRTSRHTSQQPHSDERQQYTPESNMLQYGKPNPKSQSSHELSAKRYSSTQRYLNKLEQPSLADEKSLRLIKELQAQDLGLRKRRKIA